MGSHGRGGIALGIFVIFHDTVPKSGESSFLKLVGERDLRIF